MTDAPFVDLPPRPEASEVDWDTFVSYRHADRAAAQDLARRLAERGLRVFFDERGIHLGAEWDRVIGDALRVTRSCLVLVGASGVNGVQADEVRRALDRQDFDPDFPVIVALLPGADTSGFFAPYIAGRSHVALGPAATDDDVERLADAIRGLGLELPTGPERPNPYPGLRPFDADTAEVFFGRERDVAALVERAERDALVAIVGPSGTGKSSVLLAGVLPRLAADGTRTIVTFRPGRHPRREASAALGAAETGAGGAAASTAGPSLVEAVATRLASSGPGGLVVAVDQLEEAVTRAADATDAAWLLDGLTALATGRTPGGPRVTVIVTVRSDRLGELNAHPAFGAALARATHLLGPLDADGLRDAIRRPAWSRQVGFEPGLVDTMLADLRDQPDALPLLAVTLSEMWGHRRGDRLTVGAYQAIGQVGGALAQRADAAVAGADEAAIRLTLLRLADARPDGGAVRRRRRRPELLPADPVAAAPVADLLDRLVQARLVIAGDDDGVPSYELAHDTLLTTWPLLERLLREDRRALELVARLSSATRTWVGAGRDDDAVARGDALVELEVAVRDRGVAPTPDESAFLDAGRRAARRSHRRRVASVAAGVGVVVAAIVAVVVVLQRNDAVANLVVARQEQNAAQEARRSAEADNAAAQVARNAAADALRQAQADRDAARTSELAAQADRDAATAVRLLGSQRAAGIRLAVDAARRSDSAAVRRALATAMTQAPLPTRARSLGRIARAVVVDGPDGPVALVQRSGSTVDRCSPVDGACAPAGAPVGTSAVLQGLTVDTTGRIAALGSDGTVDVGGWRTNVAGGASLALQAGEPGVVVVGTVDGRIERWLVGTGIGGPIVAGEGRAVRALAISPTGRFLAAVEDQRDGVRILSLDGQPLADLRVGLGRVGAVLFTADRLFVADGEGDVAVWSLAGPLTDGAPQARLVGHDRPVTTMAVSGGRLLTGDASGVIRRWDVATGRALGLPLPADDSASGDDDARAVVALGADAAGATTVAVHRDGAFETWPDDDRPAAITSRAVEDVGLLAATDAGTVTIGVASMTTPAGRSVALALAGPRFAAGLADAVVLAAGVDVVAVAQASGAELARYRAPGEVTALAVSGRRVAVGTADGEVAVLDDTLRPVATVASQPGPVTAVALDPTGSRLAVGEGVDVRIVDLATGASRLRRGHTRDVEALAFSADGGLLASGGDDRVVLVHDAVDDKAPLRLVGHTDRVTGLLAGGAAAAWLSTGEDGTVRLWDARGEELGSPVRAGRERVDHPVAHRDRPAVSALTLGRVITVELDDWPQRLCAIVGPGSGGPDDAPDGCRAPG